MTDSFLHRHVERFQKDVHRVGLSASFGLDELGIDAAFERGLNYVFWNPSARKLTKVLRRLPAEKKERLVIATGPSLGFTPGAVRRRVERALKVLQMDSLDVLQLYWVSKMSALWPSVLEAMVQLREEGKVRSLGISIHDRERAGRLAEESELDLFMIRYNAAHPGAEQDIFPHLRTRQPALVAYTATSWRKLLRRPTGWQGDVPSAGDCYRFCLTNENVDVVLMGPKNIEQLDENLAILEKGALSADEMTHMREFGRVVHG